MDELDSATADNLQKSTKAIEALKSDLVKSISEMKENNANMVQEALFKEEDLTKNFKTICTEVFT